ncbi:GntR family transcriptional regulator [Breznakiella homolactica]|uniref:GntR family transcriptional regulator n=1 Tax=Breznakiella homolactica TaxID=2798577 RepID=A0A7T8BAD4_9SPIR|nr:GntR family transcriptional regulator [Breznakiella homolactica]QQO08103.1 GntR family transcriptional regulator [Breznakiella homolactica]
MLDRQSALPLHTQFETIMRQKIEDEEWPINACIPSENEFSKIYGISRMTVRAVLNRLVDAGLLFRAQGKGTFVAEPKIISKPLVRYGIREQLEQMGYETSTKMISIEKIPATAKVSRILSIERGLDIFAVKRIRFIKEIPLSYHISYVPARHFPGLEEQDLENNQMCNVIEKNYNYPIQHRIETLEATTATTEEAWLLSVKPDFPLLLLENIVYTDRELPLEYSRIIFRGDRIKIKMEYKRS